MNERHSGKKKKKGCIIIKAANKGTVLAFSPTIGYELNSHSLSHLPFSLLFSLSGFHAVEDFIRIPEQKNVLFFFQNKAQTA